jgi:hypothetical protein
MHDEPRADDLRADCGNCFGLCCVAPTFAVSVDFAVDKPAGRACLNLLPDFRCGIHAQLRQRGFRGCTVFDCYGAGQQVSQMMFAGRDWRQTPESGQQMFDVFGVVRQLNEIRWLLREALSLDLPPDGTLAAELGRAFDDTTRVTGLSPVALLTLDLSEHRSRVGALLRQASDLVRAGARHPAREGPAKEFAGADLVGARLAAADLRGANLRGAVLLAADLRRADLRVADLAGTDVRDADLGGADLTGSLFLTQAQLDAARGDATTTLPPALTRPAHWPASTVAPERRAARRGRQIDRRGLPDRRNGGPG